MCRYKIRINQLNLFIGLIYGSCISTPNPFRSNSRFTVYNGQLHIRMYRSYPGMYGIKFCQHRLQQRQVLILRNIQKRFFRVGRSKVKLLKKRFFWVRFFWDGFYKIEFLNVRFPKVRIFKAGFYKVGFFRVRFSYIRFFRVRFSKARSS